MAFSRFKHPARGVRKNIFRILSSFYPQKSKDLETLLRTGFVCLDNEISEEIIEIWKRDYSIQQSSYVPASGNIAFPFYNRQMHEILLNSKFIKLIEQYYLRIYRKKPVLQTIPSIIITYPEISQKQFDNSKNHFPAGWHIDYPYEFTVHIPFEMISLFTSHTKYIPGSQYRLNSPKLGKDIDESIETVIDCLAKPGDVLCLDVEGWHRAQLEMNSYRAMIQLKFTAGNDLLHYRDNDKQKAIIARSIGGIKNHDLLKERLEKDLGFIESLTDLDEGLSILNDNKAIYRSYLKL